MLPVRAYQLAGSWAVWAWSVIVVFSFLCACVFGSLCVRYPGDAGVANAIDAAFGKSIRNMTSLFLIFSVPFGAAAVLLTASEYLVQITGWNASAAGYGMIAVCVLILCCRVDFMGGVSFALSSLCAATLFLGALTSLLFRPLPFVINTPFEPDRFGHTVLILLWAVFGWEIIGNYTRDVRDTRKTTTWAVALSFVVIAAIDLSVAMAVQWSEGGVPLDGGVSVAGILYSLFGAWSQHVSAFLGVSLCATAWLLYTGGTSRLIASLSDEGLLPRLLGQRSKAHVPVAATVMLGIVNCAVLFLAKKGVMDFEGIVGTTNCFMSTYALIGAMAAIKTLKSKAIIVAGSLLVVLFGTVLALYSPRPVLILILALCAFFSLKRKGK